MKPTDLTRKEVTHERIVEVAARAIRRTGYGGTGVADIMKEAGLTHGGFYAHFASKEALVEEACIVAIDHKMDDLYTFMTAIGDDAEFERFAYRFLKGDQRTDSPTCPMAMLGPEIALLSGFVDGRWMCWRPGEESFDDLV